MCEQPKIAFTHGGKFHADDVFSTALLRIVFPGIRLTRGYDVPQGFDGIVYDIGGGEFDHHGPEVKTRESGVPYAAFGLLWRRFGPELVGQQEADYFDEHFVAPLDLDDNTGCGSSLAAAIGSFNPGWDSTADENEGFEKAAAFAQQILENRIELIRGDARAKALVDEALAEMKGRIAVLPRFAPWKRAAKQEPRVQFVVYPSQRGGFAAQAVTDPESEDHALKCPFPATWAGLRDETIAKVSGIATLRFCHNSRFMVTAGTQEDVIAACKAAQQEQIAQFLPQKSWPVKAVVSDCDGTIVSELEHEPSEAVRYQLRSAKEQGIKVIVASGRILPVIPKSLRGIADYYVCGNGALAADAAGNTLRKDTWTKEETADLWAFCKAQGAGLSLFFEDGYNICSRRDDFVKFYELTVGDIRTLLHDDPECRRYLTEAPYGAFYIGSDEALAKYLAAHPDMQAAPFMSGYYDIYKKTTNKAKMIEYVLDLAGVDWQDTVAFGDGGNDVEMLCAAGRGYAMENARAVAKQAANAIAPAVSENGVAQVLRKLIPDVPKTDE